MGELTIVQRLLTSYDPWDAPPSILQKDNWWALYRHFYAAIGSVHWPCCMFGAIDTVDLHNLATHETL